MKSAEDIALFSVGTSDHDLELRGTIWESFVEQPPNPVWLWGEYTEMIPFWPCA